ncbi:MAG: HAD-IA family hydrolase [Candidatus Aegiribacteria sp.]|nr:HAD-IA family hydrolase [Candidatus Aegiribacteria sp.]MBD3294378.1 HAD-IA family hydrolase [Candidatus Fermentibacteria bacterium]
MDPEKYRAVLFDLDGTLLDYAGAQEHAAKRILDVLELEDSPGELKKVLDFLMGKTLQDLEACKPSAIEPGSAEMKKAFLRAGLKVDPIEFIEVYFEGLEEHGVALPGVEGLLAGLKGKYTVGVVSNGPGPVQRKRLRRAGLMEFLDLLVLSCEVEHAKPDPEILRIAMKLAGSETFSTLFVGDSAGSDMGAANAAGVDFVFISQSGKPGAPGPRVLQLAATEELLDYL